MNTNDELSATVLALRLQVEHLQAENARLQAALTQLSNVSPSWSA